MSQSAPGVSGNLRSWPPMLMLEKVTEMGQKAIRALSIVLVIVLVTVLVTFGHSYLRMIRCNQKVFIGH